MTQALTTSAEYASVSVTSLPLLTTNRLTASVHAKNRNKKKSVKQNNITLSVSNLWTVETAAGGRSIGFTDMWTGCDVWDLLK